MSKKLLLAAALASALGPLLWLLPRGACAALDCRGNYRATAPDTIVDQDCEGASSFCRYSQTKFWQITFADGHSEPSHPNATGMRIRHNPDFNCRPEFHEPTFQRLTGDKARWSQLVHHGILTPDAACVQSRTADEFVVIRKCFDNDPTINNPDICPGEGTLGGAGDGGFLPNEDGGATPPPGMNCTSPVLVDVAGDGFALTDVGAGVQFDLNGNGALEGRLAWTEAGTDDAWLALDRDGDGLITSGRELFGNFTEQPDPPAGESRNGFLALAGFDQPSHGGNADGVIDAADFVFASLRLWRDSNHDGVSQAGELHALSSLGVARLHLSYKDSKRVDEHGNRFKYRAKVDDAKGGKVSRWAWDVFLVASP